MGCDCDRNLFCNNINEDYKKMPAYKAYESMKSIIDDFNNKDIKEMNEIYLISTDSIKNFINIIKTHKALGTIINDKKKDLIKSFKNYEFEKDIKILDKYEVCKKIAEGKKGENEFIIVNQIFIENMKIKNGDYQTVKIDKEKQEIKFLSDEVINFEEIKSKIGFFKFKVKQINNNNNFNNNNNNIKINNNNQNTINIFHRKESKNYINDNNLLNEVKDNNNEINNYIKTNNNHNNDCTDLELQTKNNNSNDILDIKKNNNSKKSHGNEELNNNQINQNKIDDESNKINNIIDNNNNDINSNGGALNEVKI